MTKPQILATLAEHFPRWTFEYERGVWRAVGPVLLTSSELPGLLLMLTVADPEGAAGWWRQERTIVIEENTPAASEEETSALLTAALLARQECFNLAGVARAEGLGSMSANEFGGLLELTTDAMRGLRAALEALVADVEVRTSPELREQIEETTIEAGQVAQLLEIGAHLLVLASGHLPACNDPLRPDRGVRPRVPND
ncbi:hypothetical protein J4573_16530 [Actinomadura barringtoniae]|uniref:Uncharacterized protein n=1 Tax=Actinomadura barringtoniae TaxID=1427535 RepID=A0A939PA23_9ACTN|nr:hypothetical protein [Actinomadura barringtoniae]MBO2448710.1 hypothetical protein [Actinomadura barringtoniae]